MSPSVCPFCGSPHLRNDPVADGFWRVRCDACDSAGPKSATPSEAMSKWDVASQDRRLLRTVIDESPDIILMKDWDGKFVLGNVALANLYGTTPENLIGKDDRTFNPNREQVEFYLENVRSVMRSGETVVVKEESTDAETGEIHYYHSIKKPLRGPEGEPRILVIAHDVTDLQKAHREIEEREKSYSYAMAAAGEGIWDWDIVRDVVIHNPRWSEILGFPVEEIRHPVSFFLERLHEDDRETVQKVLQEALSGNGEYNHEHRMRRVDGSEIWILDRGRVVERDAEGKPTRMAGSIVDIGLRKKAEQALVEAKSALEEANAQLERKVAERTAELATAIEELRSLARKDVLTNLPNRFSANERLHEEYGRMKRTKMPYAVLMLDIDHFKQVNDSHGHDSGDSALKAVAAHFRNSLRETDFVARFGGEEFLAILPDADREGALTVAEKIRSAVAASEIPDIGHLTVSIGVSESTTKDPSPDAAVRRADKKLYEAKESGRNRVVG